ncbi:MAG: four helix bundle protein [Chloracidobacterium sp.]|nr:four helix bundle protein [Chloracidobacterium sp.]MCO5334854.1 four helix bundle protein [Pyrinomonadaceae bacterium]
MSDGGYKDLIVWQKSILLVKDIYALTGQFPNDERFGLISQMRRAAASIPSNIAEGQARRTTPDYVRFVSNAQGSLAEMETQLIISAELGYCRSGTAKDIFSLMVEVRKMLNALRRTLLEKVDRDGRR